jgi:hypothetical protein
VNRVKCPNCGKGWDTNGDGNCPSCVPKRLRPFSGQPEDDNLLMWPAWQRKEKNEKPD